MIVVWFSRGAASACAAKLTVDRYGATERVRVVTNPIKEEHPDGLRFERDVAAWIGQEIEHALNPKWPNASVEEVWEKERFMSGVNGASCTRALKKNARQHWQSVFAPAWHVLGFCADEYARHKAFVLTELPNVLPVLIEALMTKQDCFDYVTAAGLVLPEPYRQGYPNANCPGCVKATSPTYWNHVRRVDPEVFARRAAQSRRLNVRLVRYQQRRIFLDELPADAAGRSMQSFKMPECGIFCEEKLPK